MEKVMTILAALTVLTICSCGYDSSRTYPVETSIASMPTEGLTYATLFSHDSSFSDDGEKVTSPQPDSATKDRAETIDRKIIKKGVIQFETTDIDKTKSLIVETLRELNGYIENDNVVNSSYRLEYRLILRVPAEKFDLLLENISEGVDKFDSRNIDVLDITEEYIDVQSRIKTKKELQARYTELLKKAETVDDMLKIERELGNLQTEIESVEGRMRLLNDRIAFSTLGVTFYQKIESEADKFSFSSELKEGVKTGWELFLWFIIGLSYLWVFILIPILIGIVTAVLLRGRRKKKAEAS